MNLGFLVRRGPIAERARNLLREVAIRTILLACGWPADASDLAEPVWMSVEERQLLTPVSKEEIETVLAYERSKEWRDGAYIRPREERLRAAWKVRSMGNRAALVDLWRYASDPLPDTGSFASADSAKWRFGDDKSRLLLSLDEDPSQKTIVLPVVRARLGWARQQLKAGLLDDSPFTDSELGAIEVYVAHHGSDSDIADLLAFYRELLASDTEIGKAVSRWSGPNPLAGSESFVRKVRKEDPLTNPYSTRFDRLLDLPIPADVPAAERPSDAALAFRKARLRFADVVSKMPLIRDGASSGEIVMLLISAAGAVGGLAWLGLRLRRRHRPH